MIHPYFLQCLLASLALFHLYFIWRLSSKSIISNFDLWERKKHQIYHYLHCNFSACNWLASNAVWYPFGKPGDFLRRENRPVFACWGEPQIPHNAPLVRLRILRTLSFCDYRPCDFSLLISSDPTPRIRSTLALAVKSSLISVRALFSAFDTLCPFAIHIVSFCKRNIWIYWQLCLSIRPRSP